MRTFFIMIFLVLGAGPAFFVQAGRPETIGLENIRVQGDLQKRLLRNFDRLESLRFQPVEEVGCFRQAEYGWPGDMEGRTLLSLALLEQTVDRKAVYLPKMLAVLPSRLNDKGFFGEDFAPKCDEQQLSGHGWYLRGLCEYYLSSRQPQVKKMIRDVVENLVIPTKGKYKKYPIDPAERQKDYGSYSGTVIQEQGSWRLSSDIGCVFIFMDGVVQSAEVLDRKDLYPIIEEMIDRFLETDLVSIKAQTHATLTGLRGLLRYARTTDRQDLVVEAEKRFALYLTEASTENHMNYNWFGRPTHTEPCAIVDAFMVTVQLWQMTGKSRYLEEAHKIYYNGICHAQRANGGFGLEECSGSQDVFLKMKAPEAWWCCTMRGSEGLTRAAEYSFMHKDEMLVLPFFSNGLIRFEQGEYEIKTAYPYEGKVIVRALKKSKSGKGISFFKPSWAGKFELTLNGKPQAALEKDGFAVYENPLQSGDTLIYTFEQKPYFAPTHNQHTIIGFQKIYYGPLLLAADMENSKPVALPVNPSIQWDGEKCRAGVNGREMFLQPINDVVDWNYSPETYCRQILWGKTVP